MAIWIHFSLPFLSLKGGHLSFHFFYLGSLFVFSAFIKHAFQCIKVSIPVYGIYLKCNSLFVIFPIIKEGQLLNTEIYKKENKNHL